MSAKGEKINAKRVRVNELDELRMDFANLEKESCAIEIRRRLS